MSVIENIIINFISEAEDILKAAGEEDLFEKAPLAVGEVRHWKDGDYKKVDIGKWVKINGNKTRPSSSKTISKKIEKEILSLQDDLGKRKSEFIENFLINTNNTLRDRVFAEKSWQQEISQNDILLRQQKEIGDLKDEYKEILQSLYKEEKKKREAAAGKKEIDEQDIEGLISKVDEFLGLVPKNFPKYISAKEAMPDVTVDNYYLDTKTIFSTVENELIGVDELRDIWKEMKSKKEYEYHGSPKSNSEYLIDRKSGDIYRFSDHWGGKIASCSWFLDKENRGADKLWVIAKSNISNFTRKEGNANYLNPTYEEGMIKGAKEALKTLNKLVSENKKYYLSKEARKIVKNKADKIYDKCFTEATNFRDTLVKLRKKYIDVFN